MMVYKLDENHNELNRAALTLGIVVIDNAKVKRSEPDQLDVWWGIPNPYDGPGVWVWVEYKTETGKLRPGQARRIEEIKEAGLPVELIRNVVDVVEVFEKYREEMYSIELTKAQLRQVTK